MSGVLTNVLNPKALLFCSVLLPQFVSPASGPVGRQFAVLGVILVSLGLAFDVLCALAGGAMGRWLSASPKAQDPEPGLWHRADRLRPAPDVGRAAGDSGPGTRQRRRHAASARSSARSLSSGSSTKRDASPRSSSSDIPLVSSSAWRSNRRR